MISVTEPAVRDESADVARPVAVPGHGEPKVSRLVHWLRGWEYQRAGQRDLRIDLMRGFAVFAMVVDHLGGESWLYALTGGNRFFVSAAELFVFISGLTVGIVYSSRLREHGWRYVSGKLLSRAWTLYALAVWLALTTAAAAALLGLPRGALLTDAPARFVFDVITLQRTYYLVDVMLLYAFLLLLSPLALALLVRRSWWLIAVLSWGLWAAYQYFPQWLVLPWPIADNPVFNFAPWQVLFFTGMVVSRYWQRGNALLVAWSRRSAVLFVALGAAFGIVIWLHLTNGAVLAPLAPEHDTAAFLDRWFDKSALPWPRLGAFAIVASFLWCLVTLCWHPIRVALGWLLLPIGQRALYAYAAHLFLVIGIQALFVQFWGGARGAAGSTLHPGLDALIQAAGILVLWLLTRAEVVKPLVAPLGAPPVRLWPGRRRVLVPADSLLAMLAAVAISGLLLLTGAPGLAHPVGVSPAAGTPGAAGGRAGNPTSTITVPRKVAGAARGSSGLTGRRDATATLAPGGASANLTPAPANGPRASGPMLTPTVAPEGPTAVSVSGGYLQDGEFYSRALGRSLPFGLYLPPTYDSSPDRRYPVLYMLHGGGGHYSEWVAYGLPETAENLVWEGQIQPMIIVMPQGDLSYWTNHDTDGERWGDYIAFDLVDYIDSHYRTLPQASSRAIGGLSMGGFGALSLALTHPDIFHVVGAHSPALHDHAKVADLFASDEAFATVDPLELVEAIDPTYAPSIWIDAGADDEYVERTERLAALLDARGIPQQIQILPGTHNGAYWVAREPDYLRFYSQQLVGGASGTR